MMKLVRASTLLCQSGRPNAFRPFSARMFSGLNARLNPNTFEPIDVSEQPITGDGNLHSSSNAFYKKLDKAERAHDRYGFGYSFNSASRPSFMYGLDDDHNSLIDGMNDKLKKAAMYFEFDHEEIANEDYAFRPDVNFPSGMTYDTKDLDVRKPGVRKPPRRGEFETTTEEVLLKADFRNVRFLANFITEAGVIIKRSKTGISAKAQRKVAREIKTARAFGLLPFTSMGTKQFRFGETMEDEDRDFEYEIHDYNFVNDDRVDASGA